MEVQRSDETIYRDVAAENVSALGEVLTLESFLTESDLQARESIQLIGRVGDIAGNEYVAGESHPIVVEVDDFVAPSLTGGGPRFARVGDSYFLRLDFDEPVKVLDFSGVEVQSPEKPSVGLQYLPRDGYSMVVDIRLRERIQTQEDDAWTLYGDLVFEDRSNSLGEVRTTTVASGTAVSTRASSRPLRTSGGADHSGRTR